MGRIDRSPSPEGPRIAAKESGPGPAKYYLPGTCGHKEHDCTKQRHPAFSFGKKHTHHHAYVSSPGPAYFVDPGVTRFGKKGSPIYSLYGRPKKSAIFVTPGPDAYQAEKTPLLKERRPPAFSFGLRTKTSIKDDNPSPNAYLLPALLGTNVVGKSSNPAYSMTGRSKNGSFDEDLQKTPGPGSYKMIEPSLYMKRDPAYSLAGRFEVIVDKSVKPGPGAYYPEKVVKNKREYPKFSFGIKHSPYMAAMVDPVQ